MGKPVILLMKDIYYPILASLGVLVNLVAIVILSRRNCGLSKCISVYMVSMATADLLVMIINVMVYHIFSYRFPLSFLSYTPVCRIVIYMTTITFDLSVWFTVSFTFDRFVAVCFQKFKVRYCTERTARVVITVFCLLCLFKNIPFLFAFEPQQIINKVQWGCRARVDFISSPLGAAWIWFHTAWVVWLPFTLIVLFNCSTIGRILVANRTRRKLRGNRSEYLSDSEMENRRKSIILLFTVSGCFIVLWLTVAVSFVSTRLTNINYYRGDLTAPGYIATESGTCLKFLSCVQYPCIYVATQRKFREELKNVLKSPCTRLMSELHSFFTRHSLSKHNLFLSNLHISSFRFKDNNGSEPRFEQLLTIYEGLFTVLLGRELLYFIPATVNDFGRKLGIGAGLMAKGINNSCEEG
ncbi:probable G-protein coupled receptor 139 [Heterodontus francisci]|uniref:probable G-protein coupled receptor 139 n=1 Tax=Heterodontus francisci TaxID=7792 RepID=UPI00355ADDAC